MAAAAAERLAEMDAEDTVVEAPVAAAPVVVDDTVTAAACTVEAFFWPHL